MEDLIRKLCSCSECTIEEILRDLDTSKLDARRVLAQLVREGLIGKKPDHKRGKLVFRAKRELCSGLS